MNADIRPEEEKDVPGIRDANRQAFAGEQEARIVDGLRDGGCSTLSLVAEKDGRIVGHIMFSEAVIRTQESAIEVLALGPVAVVPELQREGIGSALVREGLERCARMGHRAVILLGHPGYYPRFGFSAELARNLSSEYTGEAFMALELAPDALSGVAGEFEFAPPFKEAP